MPLDLSDEHQMLKTRAVKEGDAWVISGRAMGVTKELPLQLFAQRVRAMRVYEGPSEVHRMVIARRILAESGRVGRRPCCPWPPRSVTLWVGGEADRH